MDDSLKQSDVDKQWPGFEVKCKACGSTLVELENSLGFSDTSGSWGSIDFRCIVCKATTPIVEA